MGVNGFTFDFKGLDDLDFFAIGVRGKGNIMRIEKVASQECIWEADSHVARSIVQFKIVEDAIEILTQRLVKNPGDPGNSICSWMHSPLRVLRRLLLDSHFKRGESSLCALFPKYRSW